MKKKQSIVTVIICIVVSLAVFSVLSFAEKTEGATAWFFKRTTDHTQPLLDKRLSFIEKYNAAYVDKSHGDDCEDKVLYLTFDAGYENGNIKIILDSMKEEGVCGSFFILENLLVRNADLVKRMVEEGHIICNHTANHKDMSRITKIETFRVELEKIESRYKESIGMDMQKIYRPPEGRFSELNLMHATELGYKTVFWSFAYEDWDNVKQPDPQKAKEKILSSTHNGAIILLHPTSATNASIMKDLIKEWKKMGYRFETLDKLP